jgi:hypothetical protein
MKKLFPLSPVLSASFRSRPFIGLAASICLCGCMATQNRWQASQMRAQVMAYYNDQIMENLIRTKEELPFVHVDITSLTTTDGATLSGTVGGLDTPSFSQTSPGNAAPAPGAMHAVHTIARGITRAFSWSVTPMRNTSLQILASPVLGTLATQDGTTSKTSSKTEITQPATGDEKKKSIKTTITEEETVKPKARTVYDLYNEFLCKHSTSLVSNGAMPPTRGYVPGTIKRWTTGLKVEYYYIVDDPNFINRKAYRDLCKNLFTKSAAPSVQGAIQGAANAAVEAAAPR